ncbi:MAG: hypothetical protein J7484_13805 [Microbacterium sp.]|nr:hypothetical protein [Microbacterium sp.]
MSRITDEELDRLLSAASPARTPLDAKPDAEAIEMLERIMATDPHPHRTRNRVIGAVSGVAAAIAAVVVGASVLVPNVKAEAETPQPLAFSGEATVAGTLDAAQDALASAPGPDAAVRYVRSASWSYNVDVGKKESFVVPQLITLQWEADGSGRVVIVDGEAYDPADAAANAHAEVSSSGHVASDMVMKPGDFGTPVTELAGASEDELTAALTAFGVPAHATAYETVGGITTILDQWTLTNAQESTLLEILSRTDGATALGASTDRLGREVYGLRVLTPGGEGSETVLISQATGRIVGIETTNIIENEIYPAGAVIAYRLFDIGDGLVQ